MYLIETVIFGPTFITLSVCCMKKTTFSLLLLFVSIFLAAQENMDYYLPDDVEYNPEVPAPDQFFGQQLGAWHLTHGQVLSYMNEIARLSNRAIIYEYARSHENKPLVHLLFNTTGILIFYPFRVLRMIPVRLARWLAVRTSRNRMFALYYMLGIFFALPLVFVMISRAFGSDA